MCYVIQFSEGNVRLSVCHGDEDPNMEEQKISFMISMNGNLWADSISFSFYKDLYSMLDCIHLFIHSFGIQFTYGMSRDEI